VRPPSDARPDPATLANSSNAIEAWLLRQGRRFLFIAGKQPPRPLSNWLSRPSLLPTCSSLASVASNGLRRCGDHDCCPPSAHPLVVIEAEPTLLSAGASRSMISNPAQASVHDNLLAPLSTPNRALPCSPVGFRSGVDLAQATPNGRAAPRRCRPVPLPFSTRIVDTRASGPAPAPVFWNTVLTLWSPDAAPLIRGAHGARWSTHNVSARPSVALMGDSDSILLPFAAAGPSTPFLTRRRHPTHISPPCDRV